MFSSAFCYSAHKEVSITFVFNTEAAAAALSHTKSLQFTVPYFVEMSRNVKLQFQAGPVPTENIYLHMTELTYCNVGNYPSNSFRQFCKYSYISSCSVHSTKNRITNNKM